MITMVTFVFSPRYFEFIFRCHLLELGTLLVHLHPPTPPTPHPPYPPNSCPTPHPTIWPPTSLHFHLLLHCLLHVHLVLHLLIGLLFHFLYSSSPLKLSLLFRSVQFLQIVSCITLQTEPVTRKPRQIWIWEPRTYRIRKPDEHN